ncbi:MAG TPA: flagellar motor switch protein FliM [Chthonomonadales bacterium]|nr:flagellar motor switch protein FliM [Chthonomonadales bacterium]
MVEILSQSEIEALLSSLASDGSQAEPELAATRSGGDAAPGSFGDHHAASKPERSAIAYELYDFRRPDKLSKEQLRTLQMLHETFGRLFAGSLSAYLRVSTHLELVSVEQVPYEEYMRSLNASIITLFGMPPLAGQALLELEFSIVLSMIDRLLGGPGNMVKSNSALTEIEQALTESIVDRALKDLRSAWDGVAHYTPQRERTETQAQFIQIVQPGDAVVSILFEVRIGDQRGAMSLCLPFMMLRPIAGKLAAQRWVATSHKKARAQHARLLMQRIEGTAVTCVCRLGTTQITVGDLVHLGVGDTVVLDRHRGADADLLLGDLVKFRGSLGTSGRKVAIRINNVVRDEAGATA